MGHWNIQGVIIYLITAGMTIRNDSEHTTSQLGNNVLMLLLKGVAIAGCVLSAIVK